jgi:two-component system, OmpR family, response regulator
VRILVVNSSFATCLCISPEATSATTCRSRCVSRAYRDDDASMRYMLADYLAGHNMNVIAAVQGQHVIRHFSGGEPDIVLLDIHHGQEDGLDLLRKIRSRSDVPIIVTTSDRRETARVVALELGADDCVIQPFGIRELVARIRAVLRRQETARNASQLDVKRGRYRFGGWQLDGRTRRLTDPNGLPVALTKREYTLLIAFLDAPQRPLSREDLLQATRSHEDMFDRSIDVQILRLRRKLGTDPSAPRIIRTEHGVGYVFTLPVEQV